VSLTPFHHPSFALPGGVQMGVLACFEAVPKRDFCLCCATKQPGVRFAERNATISPPPKNSRHFFQPFPLSLQPIGVDLSTTPVISRIPIC
jgi:hypothetical protein